MKSNKDTLSVIIPSWNTADVTVKCVKTVNQFLPEAKIVIVDNASSDDSVVKLRRLNYKNLKIIINSTNLGYAKACNIGAKNCQTDFVLFFNSDSEMLDDSLLKVIDYYQQNPNMGIIGLKMLNPDLTIQPSAFPPQTILNAFKEFWLKQPTYSKYLPPGNQPAEVFAVSGGALLIKKKILDQIGGWNEKYFFYYEDIDICRQAHRFGYKVIYYPQTSVIHRHGLSGKSLATGENQWKRLIPSSILYYGRFQHHLISIIIWSGQKVQKIKKTLFSTKHE